MACKIKYAGPGDITVHKGYESLEITCKLRIKIPGKALGTKIPPPATSGLRLCIFLFTLKEPCGAESPCEGPRTTSRLAHGARCHGLTFELLQRVTGDSTKNLQRVPGNRDWRTPSETLENTKGLVL